VRYFLKIFKFSLTLGDFLWFYINESKRIYLPKQVNVLVYYDYPQLCKNELTFPMNLFVLAGGALFFPFSREKLISDKNEIRTRWLPIGQEEMSAKKLLQIYVCTNIHNDKPYFLNSVDLKNTAF